MHAPRDRRDGAGSRRYVSAALEIDPSRYVSYLPLCHVAEQMFTNFMGLRSASETYFCPDLTKIKDHLVAARPHFFFAVPRVWEKFEAALSANLLAATGLKAKLATWARRVELESVKRVDRDR